MPDHYSVLQEKVISGLDVKPDGTYVDCTLGNGGHAERIASMLDDGGLLIAFDQDEEALTRAKSNLHLYHEKIIFIHANFRRLQATLEEYQIKHIDGILFDLGVSSPQLDTASRGFSYQHEGRLDMRMDQGQELKAEDIVNTWSFGKLQHIFSQYGEEKFSRQIARIIERRRQEKRIETTYELTEIIKEAIPAPARRKGGHPAKRVFQALRIAVNDELGALNDALHQAADVICIGGRIAAITFHSLEDRLLKKAFQKWSNPPEEPRGLPVTPDAHQPPFKRVNHKPITPDDDELDENRRSRSAKLRIAEKIRTWDDTFIYKEGWKKS